ncbi:MAG: hypothetical protein Q4D38_09870 [Planctomycetia bacterium]|nr:hypothetical protein [Planctomycetia bacterium]
MSQQDNFAHIIPPIVETLSIEEELPLDLGLLIDEDEDIFDESPGEDKELFTSAAAIFSSFILHLLILLAAILFFRWSNSKLEGDAPFLVVEMSEEPWQEPWEEAAETLEFETPDVPFGETTEEPEIYEPEIPVPAEVDVPDIVDTAPEQEAEADTGEYRVADEFSLYPTQTGEFSDAYTPAFPQTGRLDGRTDAAIRGKLAGSGATDESQAAVERGLRWLFAHQQSDKAKPSWGSWSFNLRRSPYCTCRNIGEQSSTTAATALALLAMLGNGNTREVGEYQQSIRSGLYYLSTRAIRRKNIPGFDLREGSMYGHALASLAICEAYAMEKEPDPDLRRLAEGCVHWILYAQDPHTGGWRYQPKEAGDITLTTWMIMVLKSAKMAGIEIPSTTVVEIDRFLKSVASEDNSEYSYQPGRKAIPSTTAIGLTARMFTGAPRNAAFMKSGARHLTNWGYSGSDLYYDYYASLFLRHFEGEEWSAWNPAMRDYLVATQAISGHEAGSWYFDEPEKTHNKAGGRLYTTALSVMILEVYYRYMPIYQEGNSESGLYKNTSR